ncbi:MAG: FAD-binding oxidoreductase [Gammaproteobacteria bacterium]|nr:FAD-binding oxidoreductase [Gammaproteobacteria bacterium]
MSKIDGRITRRALIKGSMAAAGLALVDTSAIASTQQSGAASTTAVKPKPFADLVSRMRGGVIAPGHPRYDAARKIFNDMIDRRPAAIAQCTGAADVMEVIKYAREHDIAVSVRGGGHNVAGKSVKNGAILIDLAHMNGVRVDPVRRRARAESGARLGALDRETLAVGMVTPSGTVSDTGLAGLTLGGGFGWLQRKHGMTIDNLVSADVVTADGKFLVASESEHPDLLWALRGGGGNFGVVTSFEYKTYEVEPTIGGLAVYTGDRLKDLLHFYRDFTNKAPDSVVTMAGAMPGIPGTATEGGIAAWIAVCYSGPLNKGERVLQPIKDFGKPVIDTIAPAPFGVIQTMFDAGSPPGMRHYWRASFLEELSDELINMMVENAPQLPRPGSMMLLEHMGGAVGRVGPTDTAFSNRNAQYNASILSAWLDPSEDAANIAWTRSTGDKLKSFGTGGAYVNYMADEGEAAVRAAYEINLERLIKVKRKYDPTNVFSANQNIEP